MSELRKVTVQVAEHDLAMAQACTGAGVTETIRVALKKLASMRAQQELLKLRGKLKFSISTVDQGPISSDSRLLWLLAILFCRRSCSPRF